MTHHPTTAHTETSEQTTNSNSNNNNGVVMKNQEPFYKSVDFKRFLRFGIIDTTILMLSLVAGVSIEGYIAKKIGVHGFGTIVGAAIGNSASDTIAAMPEGWKASMVSAFTGSISPTIPIFVCLFMKRPLNYRTKFIIGASSVSLLIPSFFLSVPSSEGGHH